MAINTSCGGGRNNKTKKLFFCLAIGSLVITLGGCATTKRGDQLTTNKIDPYENVNRKIYIFNDKVDDYIAEPIANAYKRITPQFMQTGVSNFFNNLRNINVVFNDVFQAKFEQSAQDAGRFAINSTVGLAGLFDVAKKIGLPQNEEDFDQTLAVWGVPQGPYLVIPLLGPVTARGIPGAAFDTAANPTTYIGAPVQLVSLLNTRANAEGSLKFIDEAALDPYVFTRESFLQWRNHLATDGKAQATSDFDDELLEDDHDVISEQGVSENKAADTESDKHHLTLHLNPESKKFEQVSHSFSAVAQSFEETAKSFEEAGYKLDKLNKAK